MGWSAYWREGTPSDPAAGLRGHLPLYVAQEIFDAITERIDYIKTLNQNLGSIAPSQRPQVGHLLMFERTWVHLPRKNSLPPPSNYNYFDAFYYNAHLLTPLPPDFMADTFCFVLPDTRNAFGWRPVFEYLNEIYPNYPIHDSVTPKTELRYHFYKAYLYLNAMRYCADLRNYTYNANNILVARVDDLPFVYKDPL